LALIVRRPSISAWPKSHPNGWSFPTSRGASAAGAVRKSGSKTFVVQVGWREAPAGQHHAVAELQHIGEDPLLDLTDCSDIVVDPFLGSGSTLIAADKTGRVCRGVELDPLYVDVIVRRFEAATGNQAVLVQTGDTSEALATQGAGTGVALRPAPAVAEAASGLDVSVKGAGAIAHLPARTPARPVNVRRSDAGPFRPPRELTNRKEARRRHADQEPNCTNRTAAILAAKLREFGCDEVSMQPPKCDIERVAMLKKFSDLDRGGACEAQGAPNSPRSSAAPVT
jgi:hypothetical protein